MENDSLDILLKDRRIQDVEWIALGRALDIYKIEEKSDEDKAKIVNMELRHYYGNTIANIFRDSYEPDYKDPIIKDALEFCNLIMNVKENDIDTIEETIYQELTTAFKYKKLQEWNLRKKETTEYFNMLIEIGRDANTWVKVFKKIVLGGGKAGLAGRFLGMPWAAAAAANQFLFETNWKKVIPTILIVSVIRKRLKINSIFK